MVKKQERELLINNVGSLHLKKSSRTKITVKILKKAKILVQKQLPQYFETMATKNKIKNDENMLTQMLIYKLQIKPKKTQAPLTAYFSKK